MTNDTRARTAKYRKLRRQAAGLHGLASDLLKKLPAQGADPAAAALAATLAGWLEAARRGMAAATAGIVHSEEKTLALGRELRALRRQAVGYSRRLAPSADPVWYRCLSTLAKIEQREAALAAEIDRFLVDMAAACAAVATGLGKIGALLG
jgi:hypothetical protein